MRYERSRAKYLDRFLSASLKNPDYQTRDIKNVFEARKIFLRLSDPLFAVGILGKLENGPMAFEELYKSVKPLALSYFSKARKCVSQLHEMESVA